jgi:Trk K+ transport system NAD-binding subunit
VLATHWHETIKIALILSIGYAVFALSMGLREYSHEHLPFEILLEPLLICMVGSFWLTNRSTYRDEFRYLLHRVEIPIFVIFFTLVGESLDVGIVLTILPLTLIIFATRLVALFIGGYAGGIIAKDPPQFNRYTWMAYVTQAGVGLGLAKEVAIEFPQLGTDFTTTLVAVIVIGQLVGPPLFKFAIRQVGEAHIPGKSEPDETRDVVIVGIENQSYTLAQRLLNHNWKVILADTDSTHVTDDMSNGIEIRFLPEISYEHVRSLISSGTDAVVAMLHDDSANLQFCELVYEEFSNVRLVARLNDYTLIDQFRAIGVIVVYPATAMVHLLDSVVRAPQLTSVLLQDDPDNEVVQITIGNPDIDGLQLRDFMLPTDVLVVAIMRRGHSMVPHGYTPLHLGDEVTLIGKSASLEEVTLKLGY